jgi:hypothetical protein
MLFLIFASTIAYALGSNSPGSWWSVTITSTLYLLAKSISSIAVIPQSTVIIREYFSDTIFSIASLLRPYPSFNLSGI